MPKPQPTEGPHAQQILRLDEGWWAAAGYKEPTYALMHALAQLADESDTIYRRTKGALLHALGAVAGRHWDMSNTTRMFERLAAAGFLQLEGGGRGDGFMVRLLDPIAGNGDGRSTEPLRVIRIDGDRQGSLFKESSDVTLAIYGDDRGETGTTSGTSTCTCSSQRTSYPRGRAVEDEDEDEVEVDVTPCGVSWDTTRHVAAPEEFDAAVDCLLRVLREWSKALVHLPRAPQVERDNGRWHEGNFSWLLRAHIATQLGRLPYEWFSAGIRAVIEHRQRETVRNCWRLLSVHWTSRIPKSGTAYSQIILPRGWFERVSQRRRKFDR